MFRPFVLASAVICVVIGLQCYDGFGGLSYEPNTIPCVDNITTCVRYDLDPVNTTLKSSFFGCDVDGVCANKTMNKVTNFTESGQAFLCCNTDLCNVKRQSAFGLSSTSAVLASIGFFTFSH